MRQRSPFVSFIFIVLAAIVYRMPSLPIIKYACEIRRYMYLRTGVLSFLSPEIPTMPFFASIGS
ncbi:hypothetical protein LLG96_19480 [bacterium]|nr:hypothetical protein [bacterium]